MRKEKPMQIILVQTEVEQALRNYVASRLTLAVGTTFSIDLAATRGANGITATIDLVEPGQTPPAATAPAPAGKLAGVKPETAAKAPEVVSATQVAQAATATQEQSAAPVAAAVEAQATAEVEQAAESTTSAATTVADGQAAEGATTKSLFGNLGRPKN
jgi:hypothetical protein